MKTTRQKLLAVATVCFLVAAPQQTHAQFFKKIGKALEDAAKEVTKDVGKSNKTKTTQDSKTATPQQSAGEQSSPQQQIADKTASTSVLPEAQFPTVYGVTLSAFGFNWMDKVCNVWDETVRGLPGQGMSLKAPGAKKVVSKYNDSGNYGEIIIECELYPNGLLKSKSESCNGGDKSVYTYNYDKQWRLQNILYKDGSVWFKYHYDQQGRLVKSTHSGEAYTYSYNNAGQLVTINGTDAPTFTIKDNQIVSLKFIGEYEFPFTFTYDAQGRWKSDTHIIADGMDELIYVRTQVTLNYGNGTGTLPVSMTCKSGEYDPKRKVNIGTPYPTQTVRCTYTYDSKGNWTSWKATGGSNPWTITRTISYYSDQEVDTALGAMRDARKAATDKDSKKQEGLWEF